MTIEIHELIIQARVDDGAGEKTQPSRVVPNRAEQDAIIEKITQRVLECLRDAQEDWL